MKTPARDDTVLRERTISADKAYSVFRYVLILTVVGLIFWLILKSPTVVDRVEVIIAKQAGCNQTTETQCL